MIMIRHTEECTGKPNSAGQLTGFALRLDELAEQIVKDARSVRRSAKRADRAARLKAQRKTAERSA